MKDVVSDIGTILIPFSASLLRQMRDWSPPVQVRAVRKGMDWSLEMRTVTLLPAEKHEVKS